jgi:hypothetical protein
LGLSVDVGLGVFKFLKGLKLIGGYGCMRNWKLESIYWRITLGASQTTHCYKGWERACKENQHGVCKQGVIDLEAMSKQNHQNARKIS